MTLINLGNQPVTLKKGVAVALLRRIAHVTELGTSERTTRVGVVAQDKVVPEHQKSLADEATQKLNPSEATLVHKLIASYQDIFLDPDGKLGSPYLVTHTIDTGDAKPIKQPVRRLPIHRRAIADAEVDKMLEQGVIEPSSSPWASPIVLVTKKDGSTRCCVDYRKLNQVTQKVAYPLPRIDESLDTLSGAKWFCTLDAASGYWQVRMSERDKENTAFATRKRLFQFKVMPFGLTNAPATFERLMDLMLHGLQWHQCLIYLDDVIIFRKTFEETLNHLTTVFDRFREADLKLKAKKCRLFRQQVQFLGHVVSSEGVSCDPEKIKAVSNWPRPPTAREVRSFHGFASYYRRFIDSFSTISAPLRHLMKKGEKFEWTPEREEAFNKLKACLVSAKVLAYPTEAGTFILVTAPICVTTQSFLSHYWAPRLYYRDTGWKEHKHRVSGK